MIFLAQVSRLITVFCCGLAAVNLIMALMFPHGSVIDQIFSAALSIVLVVVPYIFTRSVEGFPFPDA